MKRPGGLATVSGSDGGQHPLSEQHSGLTEQPAGPVCVQCVSSVC